jgi:hypothetical protein
MKKNKTFCTCECHHFNDWKEKEGKINLAKIELWMKLIAPPLHEVVIFSLTRYVKTNRCTDHMPIEIYNL